MWSPNHHLEFPVGFRKTVATMIMASRRPESLMYLLHDEIVLFIMNKCWRGSMSMPEAPSLAVPLLTALASWGGRSRPLGCAAHSGRAAEPLRSQWEAAVRP